MICGKVHPNTNVWVVIAEVAVPHTEVASNFDAKQSMYAKFELSQEHAAFASSISMEATISMVTPILK
jgi:hypothetical protein